VEASGGVEHRSGSDLGIRDVELALWDPVGDDLRELVRERLHMRADDLVSVGCKLGVGREQLRLLSRAVLLGLDEQVEPASQALMCGAKMVPWILYAALCV
jgi:hypothetical protein